MKALSRISGSVIVAAPLIMAGLIATPVLADDWKFTFAPYLWGTALNGQTGAGDLPPADVDASFSYIWDNLDFALMGILVAQKDNYIFLSDAQYVELGIHETGPFDGDLDVKVKQLTFALAAGYRFYQNETTEVAVVGGLRYWDVSTKVTIDGPVISGSESIGDSWVDPLVGLFGRHAFDDKWSITGTGSIGGFGVGSDLFWNLYGAVNYQFNEAWALSVGYRHLYVDYDKDDFLYDMALSGPLVGVSFKF